MKYGQTLEEFLAEEIAADPTFADGLDAAREETRLAVELARLREARGLTQTDLALALGVKQPQIARIERGQAPTVATLARLAQALGAEFTIGASGRVTVKKCRTWSPPAGATRRPRGKKPILACACSKGVRRMSLDGTMVDGSSGVGIELIGLCWTARGACCRALVA